MEGIATHWEAAPPRANHADCPRQVEEIRSYHRNHGYSDIAYNFLVCNHGQVFVGRGWGVLSAATCNGFWNSRYFSVCWMGGPGHEPTNAALAAIRSVLEEAARRGAPRRIGHRDACATECPGAFLYTWVHTGQPVVNGSPEPTKPPETTGYTGMLVGDNSNGQFHLIGPGQAVPVNPADFDELRYVGVPWAGWMHPLEVIAWMKRFGAWKL